MGGDAVGPFVVAGGEGDLFVGGRGKEGLAPGDVVEVGEGFFVGHWMGLGVGAESVFGGGCEGCGIGCDVDVGYLFYLWSARFQEEKCNVKYEDAFSWLSRG